MYKKNSGSAVVFLILYVNDILLNGNDVLVLQLVNILSKIQYVNILSKNFLHERP